MLKNKMLKQTNEIWKLPKVQQSMSVVAISGLNMLFPGVSLVLFL